MSQKNFLSQTGLATQIAAIKAYVIAAMSSIGQSVTFTLPSSSWSGSAGAYTKSITVQGVTANTIGEIGISTSATDAQRSAAQKAGIKLTGQTADTLTFTARSVPSTDIPLVLNVIG